MSAAPSSPLFERLFADLHAPVDAVAFAWFRRFFLGKLLFFEILSIGGAGLPLLLTVARASGFAVSVALSESSRWCRLGVAPVLAFKLVDILASFPFTVNHAFLEAALLLLLASFASNQDRGPHPVRVAQAGIITIFFWAGIHKVADGYYLDGQFLALRVLYDEGDMGRRLRWVLELFGRLSHLPALPALPLPRPSFIVGAEVATAAWVRIALQVLSNSVWMAEVGLPISMVGRASRRFAAAVLLVFEVFILLFTGEISFAFTVVACLLAFFPRIAGRTYPLAFLSLVGCKLAGLT